MLSRCKVQIATSTEITGKVYSNDVKLDCKNTCTFIATLCNDNMITVSFLYVITRKLLADPSHALLLEGGDTC